jgi:bifunctional non-homologous end joining protein LigD
MKESISLFYREGSSDKVYHAQLEPSGTGWLVNIQYGRRGSTLATGSKTPHGAVPYENAKKAYEKAVAEKKAKGYTVYEGGTPYASSDKAGQVSGLLPQLLNPVDEAAVEKLLTDSRYCMQEKFDGKRMMIRKKGAQVDGINRKGLVVALPEPIQKAAEAMNFTSANGEECNSFIIDGEAVGDVFYAFDMLEAEHDLRTCSYDMRLLCLTSLLDFAKGMAFPIRLVPTAWSHAEKRTLLAKLQDRKAEGAVFKDFNAPYTIGRPNSGGPQLKFKFYASATVAVEAVNEQRSVRVAMPENPEGPVWVTVGNVTIPLNQPVPRVGQVLEVRYLYAYPGGALYQPISMGIRDDKDITTCDDLSTLKFKPEGEEEP